MEDERLPYSWLCIVPLLACSLLAANAWAQGSVGEPGGSFDKPNPVKNVYFGEQHLHTAAFYPGLRQVVP